MKNDVRYLNQITNKGITLIALVISVVVILILLTITINLALGDRGLLTESEETKKGAVVSLYEKEIAAKIAKREVIEEITDAILEEILEYYGDVQYDEEGSPSGVITKEGYLIEIEYIWDAKDKKVKMPTLVVGDITFTYTPSNWTNGNVVVTIATSITGYTLQYSKDGTTWTNYSSGITYTENGIIYGRLTDGVNTTNVLTGNVTNIDKTNPVVGTITVSTNRATFTATDTGSGINAYGYSTSSSTQPSSWTTITATTSLTNISITGLNANATYYIWVKDQAGNIGNKAFTTRAMPTLVAGNITFTYTPSSWTNGNVVVTMATSITGYTLQYSTNGTTWTNYSSGITYTENGIIYGRLTDGTNVTNVSTGNITNIDKTAPSATISLSSTSTTTVGSITATVTHTDIDSGVNITSCKWIYTTTSNSIGTTASSYTGGTFSSNLQTITLNATTAGTYYLHVLSLDNAGNVKETISSAITVTTATLTDEVNNGTVKIGDYVAYTPTSSSYTVSSTYSGYSSNQTILTESLNWRVLDVVNGQVRLISATPTSSSVSLEGYQGYNNAVYLLDNLCKTLYSGSKGTAQSLKIEDIEKYLTYDYTQYENAYVDTGLYGGTKEYTSASYRYYPSIFAQETTGWVDGTQGTTYELSQQNSLINQTSTNLATSKIKITQTDWYRSLGTRDFDNMYYKLFMNNGSTSYSSYWLASRCVNASSSYAGFRVRYVEHDTPNAITLYNSSGFKISFARGVRPVVSLNSGITVDSSDISKDGTTAELAWELK